MHDNINSQENWEQTLYNHTKFVTSLVMKNKKNPYSRLYLDILSPVSKAIIESVMVSTYGNQSQAARLLGISRGTLRMYLMRHFDRLDVGIQNTPPSDMCN